MIDTKLNSDEGINIDLRQLIHVMRKWGKVITLITLLTTLTAGLISFYLLKPVYQAKTLLMVTVASDKLQVETNPLVKTDPTTGATAAPIPVLTMNTYLGQLESDVVMRRVITTLNLPDQTVEKLSKKIAISIIKDSNLIEIKVNDTDPVLVAKIANTISSEYLDLMQEYMFSSVVVISPASIPTIPVKPNKQLNIAIAFMLGLIVSSLLACLLEYLDNTLKSVDDVNRELNLPVLGIIPLRNRHNTRQTI